MAQRPDPSSRFGWRPRRRRGELADDAEGWLTQIRNVNGVVLSSAYDDTQFHDDRIEGCSHSDGGDLLRRVKSLYR